MFCKKCGAQLNKEARFCPSCGAKIKQRKKKKGKNKIVIGIIILLLLIEIIMIAGMCIWAKYYGAEEVTFVKTDEGVAIVESAGKYGIADLYGNLVIPCVYDEISEVDENGERKGLLDNHWKKLDIPEAAIHLEGIPLYDDSGEYYYVTDYDEEGYRWGVDQYHINAYKINKDEEIEETYAILGIYKECLWLYDSESEILLFEDGSYTEADYTWVMSVAYENGLLPVERNGKWGCINIKENGREVIPCKYDEILSFTEELSPAKINGKAGYIDANGKEVIPFQYDDAEIFQEGLAAVERNGKWGYVNQDGEEVIPCQYDITFGFSEGLAVVVVRNENGRYKYGYTNKEGKRVIPLYYDTADNFSRGLARIEIEGKWGYINKSGDRIAFDQYDFIGSFSEGLAGVSRNGYDVYINKSGKEIIPCQYDIAGNFSEGLANVAQDEKWGYINENGEEVIPCQYDKYAFFSEGLVYLTKAGVGYLWNKEGICFGATRQGALKQQKLIPYTEEKSSIGYGLCMGEDGVPYSYNGNYAWDMKALKRTNKYLIKALTADRASWYAKIAYMVDKENVFTSYNLSLQYEKMDKDKEAEKYKEIYNQKTERIRENNFKNRENAINSYTNSIMGIIDSKGEVDEIYYYYELSLQYRIRSLLVSQSLYLLFDCPTESNEYIKWAKKLQKYEEAGLIAPDDKSMLLEIGYYITGEDFSNENTEMPDELTMQARKIREHDSYREREEMIYILSDYISNIMLWANKKIQ